MFKFSKKIADCDLNLLSLERMFRSKIWAPSEFPEKKSLAEVLIQYFKSSLIMEGTLYDVFCNKETESAQQRSGF